MGMGKEREGLTLFTSAWFCYPMLASLVCCQQFKGKIKKCMSLKDAVLKRSKVWCVCVFFPLKNQDRRFRGGVICSLLLTPVNVWAFPLGVSTLFTQAR